MGSLKAPKNENSAITKKLEILSVAVMFGIPLVCLGALHALLVFGPLTWSILAGLTGWAWYDKVPYNGKGRPIRWVRNLPHFKYIRQYFQAQAIEEVPLDPKETYLFALHPHGIFGAGAWLNLLTNTTGFLEKFDYNIRVVTISMNFLIPIWRSALLFFGFTDASKQACSNVLKNKTSIGIVVGGAAESLNCHPGSYELILLKRTGFIKLALEHGVKVVPVFTFGENDLYHQVKNPKGSWVRSCQEFMLKRLTFAFPIIFGRGLFQEKFGIIPHRVNVITVFGKPIEFPKVENPSNEIVKEYLDKYIHELILLFERNRTTFAPHVPCLKIIEQKLLLLNVIIITWKKFHMENLCYRYGNKFLI